MKYFKKAGEGIVYVTGLILIGVPWLHSNGECWK